MEFATRKWIEVNGLCNGQYSASKNLKFKSSMIRSDLYAIAMHILLWEGKKLLQALIMLTKEMKSQRLRIIIHLDHAY